MFELEITARVACPVCAGAVGGMSAAEMHVPGLPLVTDNDVADARNAAERVFNSLGDVTATELSLPWTRGRVRCQLCFELSDDSLYFVLSGEAR